MNLCPPLIYTQTHNIYFQKIWQKKTEFSIDHVLSTVSTVGLLLINKPNKSSGDINTFLFSICPKGHKVKETSHLCFCGLVELQELFL